MRLVSVVLGAPSVRAREDASAALLNYGYTFFETIRVKAARETVLKPRVYKSATEFAPVGVPYDVYATVGRGLGAALRTSARLSGEPLIAPPSTSARVPGLPCAWLLWDLRLAGRMGCSHRKVSAKGSLSR